MRLSPTQRQDAVNVLVVVARAQPRHHYAVFHALLSSRLGKYFIVSVCETGLQWISRVSSVCTVDGPEKMPNTKRVSRWIIRMNNLVQCRHWTVVTCKIKLLFAAISQNILAYWTHVKDRTCSCAKYFCNYVLSLTCAQMCGNIWKICKKMSCDSFILHKLAQSVTL